MIEERNKFYNLKYDRVFKTIVQNNPRVLEVILSDILDCEVEIVTFVPTELPIKNKRSKVNTLDILLKTKDNKILNVELNTNFDKFTKERNLVYYTSLYSQKKLRGSNLEEIDEELEVIHIDINFNESKKEEAKRTYYIQDESGKKYSDNFKIITVNIAKYKEEWYDKNIKGNNKHIYLVMLDANEEELGKLGKIDKIIEGINKEVEKLNDDFVFKREISREEENEIRTKMRIKEAKQEGISQGISQGKIEGEKSKAMAIATNMLNKGLSIEEIIELTGLTKEELEDKE